MHYDAVIIGGGPVGTTAAALLARVAGIAAARVALLAPDLATTAAVIAPGAAPDLRVSALARSSKNILCHADAWQRLSTARLCPYERMRVWHESMPPDGNGTLQFDAAELAEPDLGVIAENRAVTRASLDSFTAAGGTLLHAALESLQVTAAAVNLQTSSGLHTARLVVGADGAHSQVRAQLGIQLGAHDYDQSAIVALIATARAHQNTAWQRFLATGPLAFLPLFDGHCSIVWSAQQDLAQELMALPARDFERRLDLASDRVLGETRLAGERAMLPLRRATARRLVAQRVALIGDAAHQIHPLAGQGVNLGLLDAAALCDAVSGAVATGEDPGSARALRRYEQQRLTHDTLMSWTMSAFNALFSNGSAAGWVAARMLGMAAASGPARRTLARHAMGIEGELPRLAL